MWSRRRVAIAIALTVIFVVLGVIARVAPADVTAWATLLEGAILAVAALFAWSQLAEMREARIAQTRPYVIAYIHPNSTAHTIIDFVIANVGKTAARNVRFRFEPPLSEISGPAASFPNAHWAAFESGLPLLAPGQQLSCLWAQSTTVFGDNTTAVKRHSVSISYSGDLPANSPYADEYVLDAEAFFGLMRVAGKGADDAVRALEDIKSTLSKWTERDGVRIYSETLSELRERRAEEIHEFLSRHENDKEGSAAPPAEEAGENEHET
ncbi:MAG TPA: hypothetical protein VMW80_09560 [Candidatus Dormibacteraeota bacterium]|nr:hypothetical protein [Candidatus Dormibacteraeota bacterium]